MAIPRPNHTQVPNSFIDETMRELKGAEVKVFLIICRKTIGWHKETDSISVSQIMDFTGLSDGGAQSAIHSLEERDLIVVDRGKGGRGLGNSYTINFIDTPQKSVPVLHKTGDKIVPLSSVNPLTLYPPQKKEDKEIIKESALSLFGANSKEKSLYPVGFQEFWAAYPRKKEKVKAFKMWKVAIRQGAEEGELAKAARSYAAECEAKGRAEDYIKHPATFLGPNDHWRDYLKTETEIAVEAAGDGKVQCQSCGAVMVPAGSLCTVCRDPIDGGLKRERERRRQAQ